MPLLSDEPHQKGKRLIAIEDSAVKKLLDFLRDTVHSPDRAFLDVDSLPEELRELGEGLVRLSREVTESRDLAARLARGDLSGPLPPRDNEISSSLKTLHSSLKHLTWQTQQIAKGDYSQRVEFMGDFADAFNTMTRQLRERSETARMELEIIRNKTQELERSNGLFKAVTERMPGWILVRDKKNGERLYANRLAEQTLVNSKFEPELVKKLLELCADIEEVGTKKAEFSIEVGGSYYYYSVMLYPIEWYGSDAVAAFVTDIGAEREQMKELENAAFRDMLTGAYNRRFGMKTLNEWMDRGEGFVIGFIDLDRLKYVNDVFGHAEGDKYILSVSKLLEKFSIDRFVCRLGGDEFMVMAKDRTAEESEVTLESLRNELISQEYFSEKGNISYSRSISYGVVSNEDKGLTVSELLSQADEKMYKYKRAHRSERMNRYQYVEAQDGY